MITLYKAHLTLAQLPPELEEECVFSRSADLADTLLDVDVAFLAVLNIVDD